LDAACQAQGWPSRKLAAKLKASAADLTIGSTLDLESIQNGQPSSWMLAAKLNTGSRAES